MRAFVIMPFSKEFDDIFGDLIQPTLADAGFEVERADSFIDQENVIRTIVNGIASADLVVADLTGLNPNVLYELGVAHALEKRTALLTQSIDTAPFDLAAYRMLEYSRDYRDVEKLRSDLRELAENVKLQRGSFGSPVADFVPRERRVQLSDLSAVVETERFAAEGEFGILDYSDEAVTALVAVHHVLTAVSERTTQLGERLSKGTEQARQVAASEDVGAAGKARDLASGMGKELAQYASFLNGRSKELGELWSTIDRNLSGWIELADFETDEERTAAEELLKQLEGFLGELRPLLAALKET